MGKKVIVTGATGRIGRALLAHSHSQLYEVHAIVRRKSDTVRTISGGVNITYHAVGDLAFCNTNALTPILQNADAVIHLAAMIAEDGPANESATVKMAENVAKVCAEASVPYIIHLSSISARLAQEAAANSRLYGQRKLEAEHVFNSQCADNSAVINLRPPAVYGDGMGGPLSAMISLVRMGIPLPFARAREQRDYISINNLVDLVWSIIKQQLSCNSNSGVKEYEPCDGLPLTTNELTKLIANSLGRRAIQFPVPIALISSILKLLGKAELADGAFGYLKARGNFELKRDFGWAPIETMPESLEFLRSSTKLQ